MKNWRNISWKRRSIKFISSEKATKIWRKLQKKIDAAKGQTKSKWFFQAKVSSKKRTNEFYFTTMIPHFDLFSFVFWKKLKTPKIHFEINGPLDKRIYELTVLCIFGVYSPSYRMEKLVSALLSGRKRASFYVILLYHKSLFLQPAIVHIDAFGQDLIWWHLHDQFCILKQKIFKTKLVLISLVLGIPEFDY